ncbi:MAG: FAD binding domain-containing protein [Alcanivoracaceae bacterium]|nr:FAD binding domain-containing protein [Alcanivoracaceae bacterium]
MIEFILNNKKITTDANKSMTLVDFIRENRNLKGTKIVCREGDCGACTVLVGQLCRDKKSVSYQTITSCISPLANAHGKHIVTVEGLNIANKLNQVQQYLKDNYASQCGFCTPGFVVAMINYCLNADSKTEEQMLDAISGNICRCTGYVAIINAAKKVVAESKNEGKKLTLKQLIQHGFIPAYFADIFEQLKSLDQIPYVVSGQEIIAGGTDLYVQQADTLLQATNLRYILQEQSQTVAIEDNECSISGIAKVSDLFDSEELNQRIPHLREYLRLLSSEAIRNMATIGGNFVNASPIGDMSIFLLALDAQLLIAQGDNSRTVALKDFFLDYKKIDIKKDESIAKITFSLPNENSYFHFEKVSKRKHLDIATVNSAILIKYEDNRITNIDLSVGGVAAIPKYLVNTCQFLKDKEINSATLLQAIEIMNQEISPISDVRGTAEYKRLLANQLLKAHFIKLFPEQIIFEEVVTIVGEAS